MTKGHPVYVENDAREGKPILVGDRISDGYGHTGTVEGFTTISDEVLTLVQFDHDSKATIRAQSVIRSVEWDKKILELAPLVASIAPVFPSSNWEQGGDGCIWGTWAEDGNSYSFSVPEQLVPAFLACQKLVNIATQMLEREGVRETRVVDKKDYDAFLAWKAAGRPAPNRVD